MLHIQPDYITDDLEDIVNAEIHRLSFNLEGLKESGRLCSDDGRFIVLEFGFKGDTDSVIKQMEEHIQNLKDNGIKDTDRVNMQSNYMNACTIFAIEEDETKHRELFKDAMKKGDINKMQAIVENIHSVGNTIHDKKECLCYSNM